MQMKEVVARRCSYKFLKIRRKTPVSESFSNKVAGRGLKNKKNTYIIEQLRTTAPTMKYHDNQSIDIINNDNQSMQSKYIENDD